MSIQRGVRVAALIVALAVCAAGGCCSARYLVRDANGGVVAIPSNQSGFPLYYREDAEKLMSQACPKGYTIVREEEVVVGQVTTNTNRSDTEARDLTGRKNQSSGTLVTNTASQSVETHDKTEYRITFKSN
jgi:hypothetical protein